MSELGELIGRSPRIIALGEKVGWWHMAITWEPYFLALLWIDCALSAFPFLITWRIARRFGWRGLTVVVVIAAVIGPPRDYWYMERFPEWGAYGPGVAPVLAISATYVLLLVVGHGVMRLVAGPARGSLLARRPWEAAEPSAATDPAYVFFFEAAVRRSKVISASTAEGGRAA